MARRICGENGKGDNRLAAITCFVYGFVVSIAVPSRIDERRFTADEYQRLGEFGVIGPEERVELIEGKIIRMSPVGPFHSFVVQRILAQLAPLISEQLLVFVQNPIRLNESSEPEPDIAVVKGPADTYRSRLPGPDDILLLIEVADSSLKFDRGEKLSLYAEHRIPEVWVVNLVGHEVESYSNPIEGRFQSSRTVVGQEKVEALRLNSFSVSAASLGLT